MNIEIVSSETRSAVRRLLAVAVIGLACGSAVATTEESATAATPAATPLAAPARNEQARSYAIGMTLGAQLRKQFIVVDPEPLMQGLKDALSGGKTQLTAREARAVMSELQKEEKHKQAFLQGAQGLKNKQDGAAFLAENKTRDGVVALPSGLQYRILKAGEGSKPTAEDTVVCNYRGTLIDGTEFDNSAKRAQPATFTLDKIIKGWKEALQLMPVGSRWQLFVPADLAYGERAAGHGIGPNATLVFDLELLAIQPKAAAAAPAAIDVSFKVDPQLSGPTYGGERWISPAVYTTALHESKQVSVDARAEVRDAKGQATRLSPKWTVEDAEMVAVSPAQGGAVTITVKRPGKSTVQIASGEVSKALSIKAGGQGAALQVEISQ